MLPHSYTYAVVFERYKAVHDQLEKSQKKLEESQKQQGGEIEELKKEVQSLKEKKSQLKQEIYKTIGELETKVDANTKSIENLESELSRAIKSFSKSNDEEGILHRLMALEEKVKPSTEALYGYHDKKIEELEERIKNLEEERENSNKFIKNLFDHNAELNEQMNNLSETVTMLENQQATGEDKSSKSWWPRRNGRKKKIPVQDNDHSSSSIPDKATRSDKVTPTSSTSTSLKHTFTVSVEVKESQNNESLTFKRGHKRASSAGDIHAAVDKRSEEHESLKKPLSSSRVALNKI